MLKGANFYPKTQLKQQTWLENIFCKTHNQEVVKTISTSASPTSIITVTLCIPSDVDIHFPVAANTKLEQHAEIEWHLRETAKARKSTITEVTAPTKKQTALKPTSPKSSGKKPHWQKTKTKNSTSFIRCFAIQTLLFSRKLASDSKHNKNSTYSATKNSHRTTPAVLCV